ncbi:MAG: LPS-assembly protein LptD [Candidatus Hinthialibacter sp.]
MSYFVLFLSVFAVGAFSQDSAAPMDADRIIEIIGGDISYDFENKTMRVKADSQGDPTVVLQSQTITAHVIEFDQAAKILHATGEVRLWDRGSIMRGDWLDFDVEKEEGELRGLKSSELLENIYFAGERLEVGHRAAKKPKDATAPIREYTLHDGTVTGNDLPVPFYHIRYDRLVFAPEVRASSYNMLLVAQKWPLFYAPYFTRSLAEHKVVYFVNADYDSDLGMSWMNRVMWKPNDVWAFNVFGDYYSDAGIGKGVKIDMDIPGRYGPKGMVYGYHIDQQAPDNDSIFDGDDRYNIALEYEQDLPYDMRLSAEGHKLSDSEYRWDYRGADEEHGIDLNDLDEDTVSHINLSKWWDDQSLRTTLATRLDSFYYSGLPFIERKPQVHFEQYPASLFGSNFYGDLQLDYGRYRREEGMTYPLDKYTLFDRTTYYDEVDRFDANARVSYPVHFSNRVTLDPWVGYRGTFYMDPVREVGDSGIPNEFDDESRLMFQGGVDLSTRRTYEFQPFLDRYARMRTVVEPILQYAYHHPDVDLEEITEGANNDVRFPYIDPVDDYRFKMHRTSALMRTRIQGKTAEGFTSDFMRLSAGFEFDYLPDENLMYDNLEYFDDEAEHDDYRFSDLVEDFSIYPFDWLAFGNALRYDIDDSEIRSSYTYSTLHPIDPVRLTVGYLTYIDPRLDDDEQKDVRMELNWKLSNKYQIYFTNWFDVDENVFRRNNIGFVRNLYDCYAVFQLSHREHPTLGDDYRISLGLQFFGFGKRKADAQPVFFHD